MQFTFSEETFSQTLGLWETFIYFEINKAKGDGPDYVWQRLTFKREGDGRRSKGNFVLKRIL